MKIKTSHFYFALSLLSPLIVLGAAEIVLFFAYQSTGKHFFQNTLESRSTHKLDRTSLSYLPLDSKLGTTSVAVFGGSSAAGYGSEISFSDLLQKQLGDSFVFHNYSRSGNPFVGYQSKKLKALLPYYDVIILYSGHNEGIGYLHKKVADNQTSFVWPNGKELTLQDVRSYSKRTDWEINSAVDAQNSGSLKHFLLRLRTPVFVSSIPHIIKHKFLSNSFSAMSISDSVSSNSEVVDSANGHSDLRYPFDTSDIYFSDYERKYILNSFKAEIQNIISLLSPTQKLIIVTPVANDLYPPYLNYLNESNDKILNHSSITSFAYKSLFKGDLALSKIYTDQLSEGAHKYYLSSIHDCNYGSSSSRFDFYDFRLTPACLKKLALVRDKDALSMRVLTPVNEFILSLQNYSENVIVINAIDSFQAVQKSTRYLDNFVDILHPSANGHLLIANSILPAFNASSSDFINSKSLASYYDQCSPDSIQQIKVNRGWFNAFLPISSVPNVHHHYLEKASHKLSKCEG